MKIFQLLAFAAITAAIATNSSADEKRSARQTPKSVPYKTYWDANQWDPVAGGGFWHEKQDRRAPFLPQKKEKKQISPLLMPPSGAATKRTIQR